MPLEVIKAGDLRRRGLIKDLRQWLSHADELYDRFLAETAWSPFSFHEVAASGFLASAAAMAGYVPLVEYEILKRAKSDRRRKVNGRADLWFASSGRWYSFELKRARLAATTKNLAERLSAAAIDIKCIPRDEYHYAAGALIAQVRDLDRECIYREFAEAEEVDLAYRVGPTGENGAFLFFKEAC